MSDPHRIGFFRIGYSRIGVIDPVFEQMIKAKLTVKVTRRIRTVASTSDTYTAHPNISWATREIDALVKLGPSGKELLGLGVSGQLDGVLYCASSMKMLDRFDYKGSRYEVDVPPVEVRGRGGGFLYRKCGFRRLEFEVP